MGCTFESNARRSRIAVVFIILNTEIKIKSKISNNRGKDVFSMNAAIKQQSIM